MLMPPGNGRLPAMWRNFRMPTRIFEFAGDLDAAAILMGDERRERFAVAIHRDPGRGHDGEADGINSFCGAAKIGNGAGDGLEKIVGIDFNFGAIEMSGIGGPGDGADDSAVADDAGFDGRGTAVEAENIHWTKRGYTSARSL